MVRTIGDLTGDLSNNQPNSQPKDRFNGQSRKPSSDSVSGFQLAEVGSLELQIVDAAEACVCAKGWAKTTMEDVARESKLSRATIYRVFPGGRDSVLDAMRRHTVLRFFHDLRPHLVEAANAAELLSTTMAAAARQLREDEQLQFHLEHDPGDVLSTLSFDGLDRVLAVARVFVAPHLMRFMARREAMRLAEWATRIVVTYELEPSSWVDLTDADAAVSFVQEHLGLGYIDAGPSSSDPVAVDRRQTNRPKQLIPQPGETDVSNR